MVAPSCKLNSAKTIELARAESMRRETGLILALDETDEERALWVADQVRDFVDAIKVNWPLVLSASPDIIGKLAGRAEVICDFKVADIPNTNRLIVEQALNRGASAVIVHGFPGADSVRAAVEAAGVMEIFVVVEMSHPGAEEYTRPVADRMARMAVNEGATGVVAPATRPNRIAEIRQIVGPLRILSPGVGAQGGRAREAIRMGADHVIVGRAIYKVDDPRGAAEAFCEEIREVL